MEKRTMGSFMAALRKARGLTQQEVADRLNVSNKAVSRWERDECAPDLSLIPAIAELFGVTCDELLAGMPLPDHPRIDRAQPKVEKQRKALISRTLSQFQTLETLSIGLAAAGWLCMLGISYGLYRPVIGFFVMLLFQVASVVITLIAGNRAKAVRRDNELLEDADPETLEGFDRSLGSLAFAALYSALAAVLLSLPVLVPAFGGWAYAVPAFVGSRAFWALTLLPFLLFLSFFFPLRRWFVPRYLGWKEAPPPPDLPRRRMNLLQWGLLILAIGALFADACLSLNSSAYLFLLPLAAAAAALGIIGVLLVFLIRCGKRLLLPGLRNLLLLLPALFIGTCVTPTCYSIAWHVEGSASDAANYTDHFTLHLAPQRLIFGLLLALFLPFLFQFIEHFIQSKGTAD